MLLPTTIAMHGARAGWTGADLIVAVAVAMAESRGNERAHAVNSREDSRGLWQINIQAHPEYASQDLYDPATNARAAYAIWSKSGWGPWSAHNNGSYLLFMPVATTAAAGVSAAGMIKDPIGAAEKTFGNIADAAKNLPGADIIDVSKNAVALAVKAGAWLGNPDNWVRIAQVAMGSVLVIAGLALIARNAAGTVVGEVAGGMVKPVIKKTIGNVGGGKGGR